LPPMVAGRPFAIRKPAVAVFTLDDYVAAGIMSDEQAATLREAVSARRNILVSGGTSTGKTTLTNALLAEIAHEVRAHRPDRGYTRAAVRAPNLVALRTKDGVASLSELVRSSLRLRPDRIPSARCVGPKHWTCSKHGAPVTRAGSAPSMLALPSARCGGLNSSSRRRSSPCPSR
jgi:Flp pilus assembly CpaF family ATPase